MSRETLADLFDQEPEDEKTPETEGEESEETATPTTESEGDVEAKTPESTEESEEKEGAEEEKPTEAEGEGEGESEPTPAPESDQDADKSQDELTQLRALLRKQNQELRKLKTQTEKTQRSLQEQGVLEEPSEEEAAEIQKANEAKMAQLETVLEVMRLNPKYEDVDTVVTQSRFDDMVEGFANVIAREQGGSPDNYIDAVNQKIWTMANPYRFMYEKIKENHPDFAQKEDTKETATPGKTEKKPPEPATKTPTSVSNFAAGDNDSQSGWTAARIDALPEEELSKVPRDVYDKYLQGILK